MHDRAYAEMVCTMQMKQHVHKVLHKPVKRK